MAEPLCREKGLGVITYYSLSSGFLTGKYRSEKDISKSPRGQRAGKCLNERGLRILGALDRVARQRDSTPTTVSLAWLIARPGITAPIASATNLEQLHEMLAVANRQADQALRVAFDALVPPGMAVSNFHNTSGWMKATVWED